MILLFRVGWGGWGQVDSDNRANLSSIPNELANWTPYRHHPDIIRTPSRHPSDSLLKPSGYPPDTLKTPPYTLQTPFRHHPNTFQTSSRLILVQINWIGQLIKCYDTFPGGVGWVGLTVIIGLISVQFQLNWPTGTELGNLNTQDATSDRVGLVIFCSVLAKLSPSPSSSFSWIGLS